MKINNFSQNNLDFKPKESKMSVKTEDKDISFCLQNGSNKNFSNKKEDEKPKFINLEILNVKESSKPVDTTYYLKLLQII